MPYFNSPAPSAYDKDDAAAPAPGPSHASGAAGPSTSSSEPIFMIEHLATFTVAKEAGIMYPADGMRRLCQLEKSNGIWSQKMQLRLERNWVLIMDTETGIVMERFPAALIQEPTAFITRDPMEMYNNILVFIVADESGAGQQGEMHIFQCQSVSAQDLVRDLQRLQLGELIPAQPSRGPRGQIPPPPTLPPPEPPLNSVNVREQVSAFNAATNDGPSDISREENNDEVSSTSSEKYERDVTILNHCFDDIEKFIARLQHAAAASRELERRRRNSKSKKRNLGDGMLTMRAKPPPESEFVDIFQKFKLSFNLLAKLKAHIHDPNAPELVHFLFTPLALIVDASHDTNYDSNLPSKVVSPLLTREAVNLLIHCVTSKETELWHSLGDTWLVPRDQWKNHVPAYHPIFMDGWSPECPIPEDHRDHDHLASLLNADKQKRDEIPEQQNDPYYSHREVEESHYSSDYLEYEPREERTNEYFERNYGPGSELYAREERDRVDQTRAHSDISVDSIERGPRGAPGIDRAQESWLDDLLTRHAKIVQVTYPRTANNDKELTVVRGEYLEILDDSRKWWKARNSRGQVAHVPHTIVTPHNPAHTGDSDVFNNPVYASRYQRQGHGYNYEDSEIEGTSTSPGPDTTHRPHAIPPPAPADWVRKERLGKKGSSVSSALEREVSLKWQIRKTLTKIQKPAEKASSSLSSKVDDQDLADIETEIAELSVSSVPMPPPFPKGLFTRSKRFDISFANSGRSRKSSAGSSKSRKSSAGSSKSREGSAGSSKSREGSAGSSKSKKGSAGSSKSKDGSADSSKPKEGSAGSSKPKEGSAGSSKSKEGSAGSSKTKEGSAGCSNSKEGSAGSSKSKEGSAGSSKSKEGSAGSSKSKEGCAGSSKSEEASGSSSTFGTINSKKSNTAIQQDKMQEELKSVMMLYRGKKRNADDFKSHLVYVTERSTPREVQKWLKSKAFSDILCKKFRGMTGAELFTLTKSQLERQCGISEGRRLDGQLVLSRNASGYYATRTGELKKVLEEARQKVENVTIKEPPKKE